MKAMLKIDFDTAFIIQRHGNKEVYLLHDNGAESLIEDSEEILLNKGGQYGIEGDIFGEPYKEK